MQYSNQDFDEAHAARPHPFESQAATPTAVERATLAGIASTVKHIRRLDKIEEEIGRDLTREEEDSLLHALAIGQPIRIVHTS